jgi:hypothetical protein
MFPTHIVFRVAWLPLHSLRSLRTLHMRASFFADNSLQAQQRFLTLAAIYQLRILDTLAACILGELRVEGVHDA